MKTRYRIILFCLALLIGFALPTPAAEKRRVEVKPRNTSQSAEHRIALVIGNSSYRIGSLRNPANDARAIAAALRDLGFEVDEQINLSYQDMGRAVNRFGKSIRRDSVALFYYAGHGLQVQGSNYLVPVDMEIQDEGEVQFNTVNAGQVLAKMEEAKNPVNIVILDACRDNPYARGWKRSSGSRGLAPMDAPVGSFIAYAAAPGKTAHDGKGKNGLYTESLVRQIKNPGMKIEDVFKRVRTEVRNKSGGSQVPEERSSLEGDFYFARGSMVMKEPPAPPPEDARTFTNPTLGATFAFIPSGTFTMGSPTNEPGRKSYETQHQVTISRPFYMQTTEVTQGQWKRVMENNPSYFSSCGDDCPVEQISWNDVQEFIRRLNSMEGTDRYRLPSEAQWEYAVRAGTTTRFYSGDNDDDLSSVGWYSGNSGSKTHPVRQKTSNAWGLYDMHGNVWEWVQDWQGYYPAGSVTAPESPSSATARMRRGGSWGVSAKGCRSSYRGFDFPGYRGSDLGFRLIRTVAVSDSPSVEKSTSVSGPIETARDGRFIAYSNNETVLDTSTNLMWAAKDNGSNINWVNAKSYCEN